MHGLTRGSVWCRYAATVLVVLAAAAHGGCSRESQASPNVDAAQLRHTQQLLDGWKFVQDDTLTDEQALRSDAANWSTVSLPHTWNAKDAASTNATKPYKRGIGWYRLEFDAPTAGARHWLEFGAASIVADVWLNGEKLGEHKGAFTAFRFDVTDKLRPGKNTLLVKVDNSLPTSQDDRTAIIPVPGVDFNISGGLYRWVALISTPESVHIDLADLGGPGVYATTTSIARGNASVNVRTKLKNDAQTNDRYSVRASLLDADGRVARSAEQNVELAAGEQRDVTQQLVVEHAHLWQGTADPYQYKLVVELRRQSGELIDKIVQDFGIRQMRFDPNQGFFLNGKRTPLHGVGMHQDFQGKGWAITNADIDKSLGLVKEIGANLVRFGHYPFPPYALESANRMGLVVWAEVPMGIGVTIQPPPNLGKPGTSCPTQDPSPAFRANARQQLQELIRQQYNQASVGMWSISNEITFQAKDCPHAPKDNVTPAVRELREVAKREDPSRPTTLADLTESVTPPNVAGYIAVGGITDIWAINQYYLWYSGPVEGLGAQLDALHARYPDQPIGMSEYGAGAALTHHTDDPRGGPPESMNTGEPVVYQPEEYAAFAHELNYAMLVSKPYVWGTFVWNMFDFGSGLRNEGDLRGVNTKGLVTFDRETRKEPFYFYKANWSSEPVTHIVGRRYTDRAYPVADVKVYSNADSVELTVNGQRVGTKTAEQCWMKTCVFEGVQLTRGENEIVATGRHAGQEASDSVRWSLDHDDINIAAGQIETGFKSKTGAHFGSDHFFIGGASDWLVAKGTRGAGDTTPVRGTEDPQLYKNYRRGSFSYEVPLPNGRYEVTLGFLEPLATTQPGNRVFDVVANGETRLENVDPLKATGRYRTVMTRRFPVVVSDGRLRLDFKPTIGEAVVSNIQIQPMSGAPGSTTGSR